MSQIRLRKVFYRTNFNFGTWKISNPAKLYTGYIVTGLYYDGDFYIPETYNGLNIIGITWEAFETLPNYVRGNKNNIYTTLTPSIYFHRGSLLFIQLPARYSDACRVYPTYYSDTKDGRYLYGVGGMCYSQNNPQIRNLLSDTEQSYNYGYSVTGQVVIEKTEGYRKYTATPSFTMATDNSELERQKVGWYFEYPYFTLGEISNVMGNRQVILSYIRKSYETPSSPTMHVQLTYNVINGQDVVINSSRPDKAVSYYFA